MTTTTNFVWDPVSDCVLSELDGTNAVQAVYTNEPQQYGGVLSQRRGTTTSTLHADALGTTCALTSSTQTTTDSYLYDAWGNLITSSGTTVNPFRWVGRYGYYRDSSTGLMYVRARMYQPTVARWLSVDPLWIMTNISFTYVSNNPLVFIDSSGFIQIRVQADAFIPAAWVWFVGPAVQLKGDNRRISNTPLGPRASRVTTFVTVELEKCIADDPLVAAGDALSLTTRSFSGIKQSGLGSSTFTRTATRKGPCSVEVRMRETATIPWTLAGPSPAIDYDFRVVLYIAQGSADSCDLRIRARASGEHDGFPAYELYAGQTLIYSRMPVGDITNLYPPMDVSVFANDTAVRDADPECCCCIPLGCSRSGAKEC